MLSNNKFLEKCWYGGQPWIRLAMESESMVEKGINFIFYLGTSYDVSSMESVGMLQVVFIGRKSMPIKNNFISQFSLWALAPLQIPTSLCEGPIFYFYVFTFMQESKFFSLFLLIFSFGKHHVVRKDLGTYVQLNMGSMSYYCWHHPWGVYVGRRRGDAGCDPARLGLWPSWQRFF